MPMEEFFDARLKFVQSCATQGEYVLCPKCSQPLEFVSAWLSIHDARFPECAGWGKVCRAVIPYCPRCEEKPDDRGCLHASPLRDPHQHVFN
jgi:hypothetical protein